MSFQNVYTLRKVAENAAKSCEVCFKPSSSVLTTAENKDFFYICPSHLKDKSFASPIIDKAAEAAKKKKEEEEERERKLKEEIERVKKEYEEKKKKEKTDDKKGKEGKEGKEDGKEEKKDEKKDEKKKDNKDDKDDKDKAPRTDEPRVFALQKFVYQQRLEKRRQAEIAKRNRERLSAPGYFPSVPKGAP